MVIIAVTKDNDFRSKALAATKSQTKRSFVADDVPTASEMIQEYGLKRVVVVVDGVLTKDAMALLSATEAELKVIGMSDDYDDTSADRAVKHGALACLTRLDFRELARMLYWLRRTNPDWAIQ
jgi:hypothetical protein